MRKMWLLLIGVILCISVFVWFMTKNPTTQILTEEQLDDPNFLEDKLAVLYYSTTMDTTPGKGFVVFVDEEGTIYPYQTKGLELGSVTYSDEVGAVFFQDESHDYVVSKSTGLTKRKRDKKQYTGDFVAAKDDDTFFSIFNTGIPDGSSEYQSDIYWEQGNELKQDTLPFYIDTRGVHSNVIYLIAANPLNDEKMSVDFTLHQVTLSDKAETKQMMSWNEADAYPLSHLIYHDHHLYYMTLFHEQDQSYFKIGDIDLNKKTVTYHELFATNSELEQDYLPYGRKSIHIHDDLLYAIDGKGNIYTMALKTKQIEKNFNIVENINPASFVKVDWKDEQLFLYYSHLNEKEEVFEQSAIVIYDLLTREKTQTYEIEGLDDFLNKHHQVYAYDIAFIK
ncbi:hypothetical protein HNQ35_002533 [Cerasibacillus quisquiliarum]|uniref:Uncharacterized protein n=1 Tax=Cerasibacillus quisquiliarum TaxID=227865 RepID=A0A511UZP3_9BACI|nr:hypothetical protein [Cerasibacillus quisquiliarum]MBB5147315.1 hypothetical protein [Cerasibacillus quisquiliarum]GEN32116.1 hypothetical protein CQU01_23540 [Cerasibacillus quisquiliarum]